MEADGLVIRDAMSVAKARAPTTRESEPHSLATYGYAALFFVLCAGWLMRDRLLVNPEQGLGYWLGIIGGSMMLILLIYPLRKRIRFLKILGPTKDWFRMHMIFGLGGPLLVLFHCNFQVQSFNSTVALYSMLLVAGSGLIGRYFYARIHRGLYGQKLTLRESQADLVDSLEKSQGIAALMPGLVSEMGRLSSQFQGDQITGVVGVRQSLLWTVKRLPIHFTLYRLASRELKARAAESSVVAKDYKKLRQSTTKFVSSYVKLLGRVAQFSFYERLFSLWHIFHLPIFFVMVLAALVHVLAVHMY